MCSPFFHILARCTDVMSFGTESCMLSLSQYYSYLGVPVSQQHPLILYSYLLTPPSLVSSATGIGIIYSMARVVPEAPVFAEQLQLWIVSFFSLTLATNIICTGLVAVKIWHINRQVMNFVNHSFYPIVLLVVESGAVYSVTLLALLILYKTESWFQYVLLDAVSQLFFFKFFFSPENSTVD